MKMLEIKNKDLLNELLSVAYVASELLLCISSFPKQHITGRRLFKSVNLSKRSDVIRAIEIFLKYHILLKLPDDLYEVQIENKEATLLSGILWGMYHHDSDYLARQLSEIVISYPGKNSTLEDNLQTIGYKVAHLESTKNIFTYLATVASEKLVVMTPFLDDFGADMLRRLFEQAGNGVKKVLILRFLSAATENPSYPSGYDIICEYARNNNITIYDYSIARDKNPKHLETFHAKVILSDDKLAYIGSANMNQYSFNNSMELGVLVKGGQAKQTSNILDVIMSISKIYK